MNMEVLKQRFGLSYDENRNLKIDNFDLSNVDYSNVSYIYSESTLEQSFFEYQKAFEKFNFKDFLICQSIKANMNHGLINVLAKHGIGADTTSIGELKVAIKAGINPSKIVYSGVGKQSHEIEFALENDILQFNVESIPEFLNIKNIAEKMQKIARVSIRVNLDIDSKTNAKIATGKADTKFGVDKNGVHEIMSAAMESKNIDFCGLSIHIGSQINDLTNFTEAFVKLKNLVSEIETGFNIKIKHLDLGGGLGISYDIFKLSTSKIDYVSIIKDIFGHFSGKIIIEPGRSLLADCGFLAAKVIYIKDNHGKKFAILNAGMNNLVRPAMYGARHEIIPLKLKDCNEEIYDFVGPICETSDVFEEGKRFQKLEAGDVMFFTCAGAYGFSMSSFYNAKPMAEELIIKKNGKIESIGSQIDFFDLGR